FFFALFVIPQSPRWLARKGRLVEAREVLSRIGEPDPDAELRQICASLGDEGRHRNAPLFSRKLALPIFLAVSIGMFNQLSGINAILYYLNDIFDRAGLT